MVHAGVLTCGPQVPIDIEILLSLLGKYLFLMISWGLSLCLMLKSGKLVHFSGNCAVISHLLRSDRDLVRDHIPGHIGSLRTLLLGEFLL